MNTNMKLNNLRNVRLCNARGYCCIPRRAVSWIIMSARASSARGSRIQILLPPLWASCCTKITPDDSAWVWFSCSKSMCVDTLCRFMWTYSPSWCVGRWPFWNLIIPALAHFLLCFLSSLRWFYIIFLGWLLYSTLFLQHDYYYTTACVCTIYI